MLHVIGSAQQEVGYLGLFKKRMLWNLIYSSEDYHPIATKLGDTWSQDIGDAKLPRYFWYLERFARGEGDEFMAKNERQEASNNIHIHCLILIKLQGFVRCMMPSA